MDRTSAEYQVDSAYEGSLSKVERAVMAISLDEKLQLHKDGPQGETFNQLFSTYGQSTGGALKFLIHAIEVQAIDSSDNSDPTHEFADFYNAFPTTWTDPNPKDNLNYEVKYEFSPLKPVVEKWRESTNYI